MSLENRTGDFRANANYYLLLHGMKCPIVIVECEVLKATERKQDF